MKIHPQGERLTKKSYYQQFIINLSNRIIPIGNKKKRIALTLQGGGHGLHHRNRKNNQKI
ncbi:hypothetical protein DPC56_01515 [Methanothermobacter tenebrarum]|uniref:Uncharacterized protein n=1 Tax=Methanothermobacter tenebrarum TaxID=680118 RepID=A0A328PIH3_9EURY|nr:hypothetical protein DPC56_01515 [Methanothermobacter tenebrarum]